jgi:hypothetical protein
MRTVHPVPRWRSLQTPSRPQVEEVATDPDSSLPSQPSSLRSVKRLLVRKRAAQMEGPLLSSVQFVRPQFPLYAHQLVVYYAILYRELGISSSKPIILITSFLLLSFRSSHENRHRVTGKRQCLHRTR